MSESVRAREMRFLQMSALIARTSQALANFDAARRTLGVLLKASFLLKSIGLEFRDFKLEISKPVQAI